MAQTSLASAPVAPLDDEDGDGVRWQRDSGGAWTAAVGAALLRSAFQPIFRFSGEKLVPVAAEALVRPVMAGRPVNPARIFSRISQADLSNLEAVLRRLHARNAAGLPAGTRLVFLNIHPAALTSRSGLEQALDSLANDLRAAGLTPRSVVCEITEQREASRELLLHAVYAMRARGFLVAVDDYGTAFADPERVRQLTPDIVKIDGAQVRSMMRTPEGFSLLQRTVDTFATSGIRTVLEGIETPRHVDLALLAGPVLLQGYGLARPRLVPIGNVPWAAAASMANDGDLPEILRKRFA